MSAADRMTRRRVSAGLLLAGLLLSTPALADRLDWQALDSEQQGMLNDFRERWQDLPVEKRERLVERADRWRNLSPEQRDAVQARWREIKPLPPEAREALRQRWESMSPEERRESVRDLRSRQGAYPAGQAFDQRQPEPRQPQHRRHD